MAKVVLVDEDLTVVQVVAELIRSEGHHVLPYTNGRGTLEAVTTVQPELVVVNVGSEKSRASAFQLLERARSLPRPAAVLAITASGALEIATEVLRRGAYDYLARPFTLDELKLRI